jgi:hypothetical protein
LDADRDAFWRGIRHKFEKLEADAPDGFVVRAFVRLADGEILEPLNVHAQPPWLTFEVVDEAGRVRLVSAPEDSIAKIDVKYVPKDGKRPPGFHVEPSGSSPSD